MHLIALGCDLVFEWLPNRPYRRKLIRVELAIGIRSVCADENFGSADLKTTLR